jgi:hypothetical protein
MRSLGAKVIHGLRLDGLLGDGNALTAESPTSYAMISGMSSASYDFASFSEPTQRETLGLCLALDHIPDSVRESAEMRHETAIHVRSSGKT